MGGSPLELLLAGAAPALQRSISTGSLVKGPHAACGHEAHVAPSVGRQVARELEAAALAALHCPVCDSWLCAPVTLRCGHSICGAHVGAAGAAAVVCPVCRRADGDAVRDFLLQECLEALSKEATGAEGDLREDLSPPLKRAKKSAARAAGRAAPRAKSVAECAGREGAGREPAAPAACSRLFCSICLERFPEPQRSPVVLRCGHGLCAACEGRVQQKGRKCPLCKAYADEPARPSNALRPVFRFLNALPVAQGVKDLACGAEDLRAVHAAVVRHRKQAGLALALALHEAIRKGDAEEVVVFLLGQGADCNEPVNGMAALHVAVQCGRYNVIQTLLAKGADPSLPKAGSGETALLLLSGADAGRVASDPARLEAMEAMLEAPCLEGSRRAARLASGGGATPLHRVAQRLVDTQAGIFSGRSFEAELRIAKLLLQRGAELRATDLFGQSPEKMLASVRRPELEALLRADEGQAAADGAAAAEPARETAHS